ncbi:MAG TPA: thiopurine S-methyltransferase [Woeseiaceae bacterium]|nr:thiopurine S-methyltransferase [Woeseiaceae bacterium]
MHWLVITHERATGIQTMSNPWLERWRNGHIGWHEPDGNQNLQKFWRASGKRVLVPLCGKSPDLLWLAAQGNEVVGIELAEIAVQDFFAEHDIRFERREGRLVEYRALDAGITLYCGDYFEFDMPGFDAHYDRGALIALPPELRARYVQHTNSLLTENAEQLVITVEYDQAVCKGPPFSVSSSEVLAHWPKLGRVASIDDIENAPPKFRQAGLTAMREVVWRTI